MSRRYQMDCEGYSCGICFKPIKIGDVYVTDHGNLYHTACAEEALAEGLASPVADPVINW
ncbi:MAG: hypothetical protein XD72_2115 [Methanothrix harundinacea]|jgi:hypothetical protein|uniref:Uncharacterized protein n=1 Tax=Methanothrix harundinacea TaxID=301375 RepID=A0A101FS61_9EURY|nr:MAG: hypothetical protein XD72_2115 [Methanothrix harundinacea]KUK95079.1 MAG: hypothetical protein XE07_1943 [Methanothrix harundinacea]